jgi:hypothetical protein
MSVIQGGNIITGNAIAGSTQRIYAVTGVPVAGTTLAGTVVAGDFVQNVSTGFLYEYTAPGGVPTFTRIDTV